MPFRLFQRFDVYWNTTTFFCQLSLEQEWNTSNIYFISEYINDDDLSLVCNIVCQPCINYWFSEYLRAEYTDSLAIA